MNMIRSWRKEGKNPLEQKLYHYRMILSCRMFWWGVEGYCKRHSFCVSYSSSLIPRYLLARSCSSNNFVFLLWDFTQVSLPSSLLAHHLFSFFCLLVQVFWVSICVFPTLTQFLFHSSSSSCSQSVPWRIGALPGYLSLRAASWVLLGLSKESIEIAAKISCLSSDCSTQIWHWAVIWAERPSQAPGACPVQTERLGNTSPGSAGCAQTTRLEVGLFWVAFHWESVRHKISANLASPYSKAWDFLKKGLQNLLLSKQMLFPIAFFSGTAAVFWLKFSRKFRLGETHHPDDYSFLNGASDWEQGLH